MYPDAPDPPPPDWLSFMELDRCAGAPKGCAFRVFRRLAAQWREGQDYRVYDAVAAAGQIAALRAAGRIYPGTVNLVLLSPALAEAIGRQLSLRSTTQPAE